jgi:hypothetical protein
MMYLWIIAFLIVLWAILWYAKKEKYQIQLSKIKKGKIYLTVNRNGRKKTLRSYRQL